MQILYGTQKLPLVGLSLDGSLFGEASGRGLNRINLSELASITSGAVNPLPGQIALSRKVSESTNHNFPPLIVLAFLLLVLEVFFRELGFGAIEIAFRRLFKTESKLASTTKPKLRRQGA